MVYRHRLSDLFHLLPFFVHTDFKTSEAYCCQTLASPKMVCRSASMHTIGIGIFQLSYAINCLASQAPRKIILDFICHQSDQMSLLVVPDFNSFGWLWLDHMFESSIINCHILIQHISLDLQTSWQSLSNLDVPTTAAHVYNNSNSCSLTYLLFKFQILNKFKLKIIKL